MNAELTRRQFLSAAALPAIARASSAQQRVLVVVQLAGGNDGLNTVVPYEDDIYARGRTTLRLTAKDVLKIGNGLGFHPAMGSFERLFKDGHLSVVHGVGYPAMHRDHNAGMRIWQTANTDAAAEHSGWLGRAADQASDVYSGAVPAVFAGNIPQPLSIQARQTIVPSVHTLADWTFPGLSSPPPSRANPLLKAAHRITERGLADAAKCAGSKSGWNYPQYSLAQSLRTVANLIRADIGIRVFLAEQGGVSPGGFDNHANQAGNHAVSLRELAESIGAFCGHLAHDGLLDRVLLMTYSEFGRTLSENGRHGTGHGAAAPVFVAGGKVMGGFVGAHPSLSDLEGTGDNAAPKASLDFRSLYATALEEWLGIPAAPILGKPFPSAGVLKS